MAQPSDTNQRNIDTRTHGNSIDRTSGVPLYLQIFDLLRNRILNGEWQPGDLLPAEPELMDYYGVSRITLRQAADLLEQHNLIRRQRGKGTFVTHSMIHSDAGRLIGFSEDMKRRGLRPGSQVLSAGLVVATRTLAEKLEVSTNEELVYLKRLRLANDEPMCIEEAYLVAQYCPGLIENHDFGASSLRAVLERDYNIRLVRARQTITARLASHIAAELLSLPPNSPTLYIERISYSQLDIPVVFVCIHYRADRYALVHELQG